MITQDIEMTLPFVFTEQRGFLYARCLKHNIVYQRMNPNVWWDRTNAQAVDNTTLIDQLERAFGQHQRQQSRTPKPHRKLGRRYDAPNGRRTGRRAREPEGRAE